MRSARGLARRWRARGGPVLAVSVGTKVQSKDWGRENWRELLSALARAHPGFALALMGTAEESEASEFAAAGGVKVKPLSSTFAGS